MVTMIGQRREWSLFLNGGTNLGVQVGKESLLPAWASLEGWGFPEITPLWGWEHGKTAPQLVWLGRDGECIPCPASHGDSPTFKYIYIYIITYMVNLIIKKFNINIIL